MTQELLADLRSRINPAYQDVRGTESYERKQCADAIEALIARVEKAEKDAARLDYLQQGASVELLYDGPNPDFRIGGRWLATGSDLRTAIDSAMEASK